MEILKNENALAEKSFDSSTLTLKNRNELDITGVEKVYEATQQKFQLKSAGENIVVLGNNLSVTQLNVEEGFIKITGEVSDIRFAQVQNNKNFLKRIFK